MWRKSFLLIPIISLLLLFAGCKDENELGLNLLPDTDQLITQFSDTTTVSTTTVREDSLKSDELSVQLIGSDNDPIFGLVNASVYAQVNLAGTPAFGFMPQADSLVLVLAYSGYHGDTTASQTFNVYHLTDDLHIDSSYYSDRSFATEPSPVGSITFTPHPRTIDTLQTIAKLRIPLDTALASVIVGRNGQPEFASNAAWLTYFKGLYIEAADAAGLGSISYFNFFNSALSLYFHDTAGVPHNYNFSMDGARVNHFSHNFMGSPVGNQLNDSTFSDSLNYLQAMSGVKTTISFPYLKHFLDSGSILVNRAELIIQPEIPSAPYVLPGKLLLLTKDNSGTQAFPIDYYESAGYYGGDLNSSGEYRFNIARQIQRFFNGTVNNSDFELVVSGSGVVANRAVIKSGKNLSMRMKLSLFYTKLN